MKECRNLFFLFFRGVWNFVAVQLRHIKKKGDLHPPTGMIRADNHLSHAFCPWENRSRSQEPQGCEWWSKSTPVRQVLKGIRNPWIFGNWASIGFRFASSVSLLVHKFAESKQPIRAFFTTQGHWGWHMEIDERYGGMPGPAQGLLMRPDGMLGHPKYTAWSWRVRVFY